MARNDVEDRDSHGGEADDGEGVHDQSSAISSGWRADLRRIACDVLT